MKSHTRRSLKALASATAVLSESAELAGRASGLPDMVPLPGFALLSRSAAEGRISEVPDLLRDTLAPQKVHIPPISACKTLRLRWGLCVGTLTKARISKEVSSDVVPSPALQDVCLERRTWL